MHHFPTVSKDRIWTVDTRSSPPLSASSTNRNKRRKYERRALTRHEGAEIEYHERMARYYSIFNVSIVILLVSVFLALYGLLQLPYSSISKPSNKDMLALVFEEGLCTVLREKVIILGEREPARGIAMHKK
jgi:ABC-type anion transport system duplicated permease subunit